MAIESSQEQWANSKFLDFVRPLQPASGEAEPK